MYLGSVIGDFFDMIFGWIPDWLLWIILFVLIIWGIDSHIRSIVREEISDLENRVDDLENERSGSDYYPDEPLDVD